MRVHLISIGGAVMHNLALELQRNGHKVSGSDDEIFEPSKTRLANAGLLPQNSGWFPEKIDANIDLVILGMHARIDNPELLKAQELQLPIQSFPEFIFNHSKNKTRVVIAGSHGKTTTTAMVMHILKQEGLSFDYLVGSKLEGFELMVGLSDAPLIIIEGDEYLSSPIDRRPKFLWYYPQISVITGIAWDHINVFPTYPNYVEQFDLFLKSCPKDAKVIYYDGDADLVKICQSKQHVNAIPYHAPKYEITDGETTVEWNKKSFPMQVFGAHNLANMQAAVHICESLNISTQHAWEALQSFKGTARRLEKVFDTSELVIYKDFAHSPSKVKATVEAVRASYPNYNLVSVLELHTFSSLNKDFLPLYKDTMKPSDQAVVHFNPHVFEMKKMQVLNSEYVESAFQNVKVISEISTLKEYVRSQKGKKTVFLFMSSGNWGGTIWENELNS